MNKSAIQKFAIWARTELIAQVSQRAYQYGITEEGYGEANAVTVGGRALSSEECKQRRELVAQIQRKGYAQVMEEVAYTWFNRFIALRFMEVNNYLPSHIRVFSDSTGAFKPEILSDALHMDLPGLDKDKIASYIEINHTEGLYRYLLLTQCNALNEALPRMFEKMGGYTELLFPNNILKADSVLGRMVTDIPEEDWTNQVQIIGWLYQYYGLEKHNEVVNINKSAVTREDIPAATQLFTTDWVVRYMVDNSLGKYWIERHPESKLREKLAFLAAPKSGKFQNIKQNIAPQELIFLDPCVGSGHILVYAFDVLMEIYRECGYSERDAASEIVKNNLFGLDIDERAIQLANFAVIMKARQYDRRFLNRGVQPQVYTPSHSDAELWEFGSLVQVKTLPDQPQEPEALTLFNMDYEATLNNWNYRRVLSQKYTVVCTNPPYLNKYNPKLKDYINDNYKDYSGDLFSVFIYRDLQLCQPNGYCGFMTPFVWMFIKTYEKLREYIIRNKNITTLIQMEYSAFEEATVPLCSFVLQNKNASEPGLYFRLSDFKGGMEVQKEKVLEAIANPNCGYFHESPQSNFSKIPGSPVAYWVSEFAIRAFTDGEHFPGETRKGVLTGDNDRFLRLWHEVISEKIGFTMKSHDDMVASGLKWFPVTSGGYMRKWYGNFDTIVNLENDGFEVRTTVKNYRLRERTYYFKEAITWTEVSSGMFSCRYVPEGILFGNGGPVSFFFNDKLLYSLGLLNSKVTMSILFYLAPTINYGPEQINKLPVLYGKKAVVENLVKNNIAFSRSDWDYYETSWDFQRHPLICPVSRLADAYTAWQSECEQRFLQLKTNEEELNRIFIDIYSLHDELTPEVADNDVTVHRIFDTKDDVPESMQGSNYVRIKRDEIISLISYAVGCMFGRYSLDVEGLAYAGGDWDDVYRKDRLVDEHGNAITFGGISIGVSKEYTYINVGGEWKELTFPVDADNIIPICDDDYFEDDMTGRFVKWVEAVYGSDMLEENLKFIADALGGKGTPREVIRSYFLNDFYAYHCKTYQKRPIYWLFDSGKKNGFKALIYMHRYQSDLLARMRTDYVHEQQERYRTQLAHLADALEHAFGSERVKLTKQQKKLQDQSLEIQKYEEKIHHLADQNISIDLDDGVKHNYALFADVLAKIK